MKIPSVTLPNGSVTEGIFIHNRQYYVNITCLEFVLDIL